MVAFLWAYTHYRPISSIFIRYEIFSEMDNDEKALLERGNQPLAHSEKHLNYFHAFRFHEHRPNLEKESLTCFKQHYVLYLR